MPRITVTVEGYGIEQSCETEVGQFAVDLAMEQHVSAHAALAAREASRKWLAEWHRQDAEGAEDV